MGARSDFLWLALALLLVDLVADVRAMSTATANGKPSQLLATTHASTWSIYGLSPCDLGVSRLLLRR